MTDSGASEISGLEKRLVGLGLLAYFALTLALALTTTGTYDAGDSVMHFQIARWAFAHPENFLSHWGKPLFTLVASPFAQLGFGGVKLLQCLLALGTGWMLWRSAHRLRLQPRWLAPLLGLAAPEFLLAQWSGLTEPLFAFLLLLGVFLFLHARPGAAALALSLLPFVRTEGFLLLPVFGLYLLLLRNWRALPLLAAGTVAYMLIGGVAKGDFLWIWTENPYADKSQNYGVGGILHFPAQYLFVAGIPIYGLTILGFLLLPLQLVRKSLGPLRELLVLVVTPFVVYLGAHMFFWMTGTGHSMGLIRVLIGIVPLGALIALSGLQQLGQFLPWRALRWSLIGLVTAYVVLFPILPNPAAIQAADIELSVDQQMIQAAARWMAQEEGLGQRQMYSAHPSAAYFMGKDPFDPLQYRALTRLHDDDPPVGTLILLDSWFGRVEAGYSQRHFDSRPEAYRQLHEWQGWAGDTKILLTLYEKI